MECSLRLEIYLREGSGFYLNPNEVMRVTAIFAEKNLEFFVTLT